MPQLSQLVATLALVGSGLAQAAIPTDLVGTWSTKSNATLTGPGFYDPVNEKLIEPKLTGISYSFTADGHYEEAYYRAIANPQNPSCPSAIMQWQHGSFVYNAGGSLTLTPIAVDGRQLLSSPCDGKNAIYTRYNQTEQFQGYRVYLDDYHKVLRLDISKFDGSPMQPMYIRFKPAMMLPTTTLNPLKSTASATAKAQKRSLEEAWMAPLKEPSTIDIVQRIDTERLWWIGVGMTGIGGLLYLGPRRLGVRT